MEIAPPSASREGRGLWGWFRQNCLDSGYLRSNKKWLFDGTFFKAKMVLVQENPYMGFETREIWCDPLGGPSDS